MKLCKQKFETAPSTCISDGYVGIWLYCRPVHACRTGVRNLSLVAGQKQTLQGMVGRINFPTILFFLLYMMLIKIRNLWNF